MLYACVCIHQGVAEGPDHKPDGLIAIRTFPQLISPAMIVLSVVSVVLDYGCEWRS